MLTNGVTTPTAPTRETSGPIATQKVVIVNGRRELMALFDTLLDAGHYDVVFVESSEHAYSQIKRVRPDLVILCVHTEDVYTLSVLSMLKLDEDTRDIPVLTYLTAYDGPSADDDDEAEPAEMELFAPKAAMPMN